MSGAPPSSRWDQWWETTSSPYAIYGTIISAAVLASSGSKSNVVGIAIAVIGTVLVYWLAERWSEMIAHHARGAPISGRDIREMLGHGWPMVQAAYLPAVVLLAASLLGAEVRTAVNLALMAAIAVLLGLGAIIGRRAKLSHAGVVASSLFVGLLGVGLILLKAALH